MTVRANGTPEPGGEQEVTIRIAAAGDVHASDANAEAVAAAFAEVDGTVDLILLAGDLTTYGEPAQAEVLAAACRPLETPVITVLGNHDWHCRRHDELVAALEDAGVCVLDPGFTIRCLQDVEVGVVGAKGFVGGFTGSHLPDFGEPRCAPSTPRRRRR
jgi:uncharacterized protein